MGHWLAALRSEIVCWVIRIASWVTRVAFLVTSRKSLAIHSMPASSSLVLMCVNLMAAICSSKILVILLLAAVELMEQPFEFDDLGGGDLERDRLYARRECTRLEALDCDSPGELQAACLGGWAGGWAITCLS